MTFTFKTFPKHRATQFWNFLPERLKSWSVSILKRYQKIWFFLTFSNKLFLFCLKLNSMWKMLSFELWHIEIVQKIQILKISLIFSNFSVNFQFLLIFCKIIKKNILKKCQMSWNWCFLSGEHDFWAKVGSRAKMDGLGSTLKTVLLFKSLASATQCNSHMQFILGTLAFFVIPLEAIPQLLICVVNVTHWDGPYQRTALDFFSAFVSWRLFYSKIIFKGLLCFIHF